SPACASGSAATPPAAPSPMMTTSVSLSLVVTGRLRERLVVVRGAMIRFQLLVLERLLVGGGDHRPHTRIADQIPADEIGVAAIVRIAEGALVRVAQHHREERRGAAGESGGGAGLDVDQHRVLIGRRQISEWRASRGPRIAIQRGEAGAV